MNRTPPNRNTAEPKLSRTIFRQTNRLTLQYVKVQRPDIGRFMQLNSPTLADAHATRTIHNGSHFAYTRDIEWQMDEINKRGQKENWTQKQYKQALNKLIKKERMDLRSGKTILNKNSIRPSKGC